MNQSNQLSVYTRNPYTPQDVKAANDTRLIGVKKRFALQRTAQTVLYQDGVHPKKQHRTCWCYRHVRTDGTVPVMRSMSGGSARLTKIKTCGSVWACPVCSAKVAEVRRRELAYAMVKHTESGGHAYLITFTFPHYKGQSLAELMEPFTKARQSFQNGRKWKAVMESANKLGVVNSLEVTYGASNGWHPHLHMLVFCDPLAFGEGDADEVGRLNSAAIEHLRGEWVRLLEKRGLVDGSNREWANQFGLDVRGGKKAAEYIAKWGHDEKWGMSSELTTSHAKTGKRDTWGARDHYTPFQLLAMAGDGDGHAMCAFREFVKEFDGKRMLTWSRGLKDHFGIEHMEDEQAAQQEALPLQDEHHVGDIDRKQLHVLTKHGRVGDFLAFVAEFGHMEHPQRLIDEWIEAIDRAGPARRRGTLLVDELCILDRGVMYRTTVEEA